MQFRQQPLFTDEGVRPFDVPFPTTRYQGSKRKLVDWIWENVRSIPFDTVLDVFGGTGAVSHMFKNAGKQVTYNDLLQFNWNIGLALIENDRVTLSSEEIDLVLEAHQGLRYPDFVHSTFQGIYFTDQENRWLDRAVYNIDHLLTDRYKQALARFALFQCAIIKRPYNLFHRANLYMRAAKVERSFGNKTTWDTPFETHFRRFMAQANQAVFSNGRRNLAINVDAVDTPTGADLVYIDPPYLNSRGVGVDYRDFYHFLEGLVNYDTWNELIDYGSKHRRLQPITSPWNRADTVVDAFHAVIARHRDSVIVISYRDDGIPSEQQILDMLGTYKRQVYQAEQLQKYALADRSSHELLLIGR
jgi:adenine-specific DNA-methyltransferase